ncbi:hypothetical protein, partial [Armatimonas sp.]|uniref:hypothetical protein n=1 Tax=Armatimonas sp. TaxID=1872638 RepID=UPI00374FF851
MESIATTNSTAARNVLQRKLDGQAEEAQRLQREAATEIERRIILRGFVHKVVVISTKPLALEAEI